MDLELGGTLSPWRPYSSFHSSLVPSVVKVLFVSVKAKCPWGSGTTDGLGTPFGEDSRSGFGPPGESTEETRDEKW